MADDTADGEESAHGESTPSAPEPSRQRPRAKPTACNVCHARKVRCSGGQPCEHCRQAGKAAQCTYPRRNRLVKVSQRYLDDLIAENQKLRDQGTNSGSSHGMVESPFAETGGRAAGEYGGASGDRVEERGGGTFDEPWFFDLKIPHTPILISEAADAAFATRFRQAVLGEREIHLPRLHHATDESLLALSDNDCAWPSPSRARFLINVALRYANGHYHIVRRSAILEELEAMRKPSRSSDSLLVGKLWALFALGEMYSARSVAATGNRFPGMAYFARATRTLRIVSERPRIDAIEIRLLLSLYSLALNRRHSAYALAGSAIRLSIVMGMHLNVPESHISDPAAREHRCRVWWTAYAFDRLWASKLGNPSAINEGDIHVDLPSNQSVRGTAAAGDFMDAAYIIARVRLARLAWSITQSIYGRRVHQESLSHRVQQALRDLQTWTDELPPQLHIDVDGTQVSDLWPRPLSLHLSFNQCVVNSTRPILLHVLRTYIAGWNIAAVDARSPQEQRTAGLSTPIPATAKTLAEACVRSARRSLRFLTESWIDGSFATFNYLYTQYLFSAATIMVISSLLPDNKDRRVDGEQYEAAAAILYEIRDNGSFAGKEFCQHIDAMKPAVTEARARLGSGGSAPDTRTLGPGSQAPIPSTNDSPTFSHVDGEGSHQFAAPTPTSMAHSAGADMALLEPSLQELLTQPALDLQFIDASILNDVSYSQSLYWPDVTPGNWTTDPWNNP